jgi:hypothetical protein
MFSFVLIVMLAGVVAAASTWLQRPNVDHRLTWLLLAGYAVRILIAPITNTFSVFSSGLTYDSFGYESVGETIARIWHYTGFHYVTTDELPRVRDVPLPVNTFACVIYLNGEKTHLGCVAVVAALACFVCLDLYLLLSRQLGATREVAFRATALISVLPSFLFYTSDTYKDGFVTLFLLGTLACGIRLSRKFSLLQAVLALLCMAGMWQTRYYLIYVVPAPIFLGFLGVRSRSVFRVAITGLVIAASAIAVYSYSRAPVVVANRAMYTFQHATSEEVLAANAQTASGVTFDEASPTGSFLPKLAYTLFAPFPWQSGSIGLQIGKIESIVWYYFIYRALRSARMLWRERRADVLMFASFVVPLTIAYSMTFSNVGLIVRQRIGIVLATIVFASLSWTQTERTAASPIGSGARSPRIGDAVSRASAVRTARA